MQRSQSRVLRAGSCGRSRMLIREIAPAKINLTLRVRGRRPDGFHDLVSLVTFADDVADAVRLVARRRYSASATVRGPAGRALMGDNILDRTLALLAQSHPRLRLGMVRLDKRLPVAAGLGGGSADAAALLRAIRRLNFGDADASDGGDVDLRAVAAQLGSDVPVCYFGKPAVITGRGDLVHPVARLPQINLVLANPMTAVPKDKTAQVFRMLAAGPCDGGAGGSEVMRCDMHTLGDVLGAMRADGNALQDAACRVVPQIADVLAGLSGLPGCRHAQMSGAGPTCFAVFDGRGAADAAAQLLGGERPDWWVQAVTTLGAGDP